MAVNLKRFSTAFAAATATAVYTVPDSTSARIDAFTMTNTDSSTRTVSVWLVASGGTATDANIILKDASIGSGATLRIKEAIGQVLQSGGKLFVSASVAGKVNIYASGVELA